MKLIVSLLAAAMLFISNTVTAQDKKITATVINVNSDSGKVGFALYNKDGFMITPVQTANGEIIEGKSTVVFENLKAGEYSIVCYHDKNNNDIMDFQPNGMPLENYGSSNNVMAFAPPTYENSKFIVSDKDVSLEIKF
jgi:uncharacterized protein (DUF2141 family)